MVFCRQVKFGHSGIQILLIYTRNTSHNIDNRDQKHYCTTVYRTCLYSRIAHHILIGMKYRSRTELVSNILEAANGGATKTKIMYKAFLSYAQLKEYLTVLLEKDVLEYEDETQLFRTTEKGLRLLQMYNQFDEMMSIPNVRK